jgi:hypothetical protein
MFAFRIFTPLPLPDLRRLGARVERAIQEFSTAFPDRVGDVGTFLVSPKRPDMTELRSLFPVMDIVILERLEAAQGALIIDDPGHVDSEPLLVSTVKHLLANSGASVIDWGGLTLGGGEIETCEAGLKNLARYEDAGPAFAPDALAACAQESQPVAEDPPASDTPGSMLQERIIETLTRAQDDLDLGIEVRQAIDRASPLARMYMQLVCQCGTLAPADMAQRLRTTVDKLAPIETEIKTLFDRVES